MRAALLADSHDSVPLGQLWPEHAVTSDITASFCCHVHFLADQEAAEAWLAENQGALTLSLEAALELGRRAARPLLEDGRPQRESGTAGDGAADGARTGP